MATVLNFPQKQRSRIYKQFFLNIRKSISHKSTQRILSSENYKQCLGF